MSMFVYTGVEYILTEAYNTYEKDYERLGNVGDYLGGLFGTYISSIALLGIIFAFIYQKRQLNIQKQELEDNRVKDRLVSFENNFFKLVDIFRDFRINYEIDMNNNSAKMFKNISNKYNSEYEKWATGQLNNYGHTFDNIKNLTKEQKKDFALYISRQLLGDYHRRILEPYFRNLFQIYMYVDDNIDLIKPNAFFYYSIVRNMLSQDELLTIYFFFLGEFEILYLGKDYQKKLDKEYGIVTHFKTHLLKKLEGIFVEIYDPIHPEYKIKN